MAGTTEESIVMDIIPIVISAVSLLVAVISIIISKKASSKSNEIAKENLNLQNAMVEMNLRQAVENANNKANDITMIIAPLIAKKKNNTLSGEEATTLKLYGNNLTAATQTMLNTYENACTKYLDGRIDKVRFKKDFHIEIQNLVKKKELSEYFNTRSSSYKAILKVYDEWFDLEK